MKTNHEDSYLNLSLLEKHRKREDSKQEHASGRSNGERQAASGGPADLRRLLGECEKKVNEFMVKQFPGLLSRQLGFREYTDLVLRLVDGLEREGGVLAPAFKLVKEVVRPLRDINVSESLESELHRLKCENGMLKDKENRLLSEGAMVVSQDRFTKLTQENARLQTELKKARDSKREFEQISIKLNRLVY